MTNNFTPKKASDNRPKLSKEEYAEKKKAEKEAVYQMADEAVEEIVNDPEKFTAFLDTQSRMDRYSAVNALLIYKQLPTSTQLKDYDDYASGITQNVDDLLQSHTARTMLANSEFIIMLNQAATDRIELAKLLNISDLQMSYITNVEAGHGLIKVGSSLVPFVNKFPTNTQLYKLMTTKPGEGV